MPAYSILVADDEPDLRTLIRLTLERDGNRVVCVPDGKKASEALRRETFDLLFTDVLMPERDGLELIAEVRSKYPAVRIVVMTSGGQVSPEDYLFIAKRLGAHVQLTKPFNTKDIATAAAAAMAPQA